MLVPRRVRRRLLLPPGWVALGFLLLLGCQALRPWQRQLQPMSVMSLTIPALHIDKSASWNTVVYQSLLQLNSYRPWHDVEFQGKSLPDFLNAAATESAIQQIIADTTHAGGVRIQFLPGATYANLVKVLDIMNYTDQKKYWLDIHHEPTTLYAITEKQLPQKKAVESIFLGCCTCGPYGLATIGKETLWMKWQSLWQLPWRSSVLLLAVISSLSLWQLFRLGFRRHYS